MNHAAIVAHESETPYRQRAYVLADLDDQHFEALNTDAQVLALNGYCLDAMDVLPAGGMAGGFRIPAQAFVTRGVSLAEEKAMAAEAAAYLEEWEAENHVNCRYA